MRGLKQAGSGYGRKTALLEEAITQMNAGKYGRASASLKELLAMDPHNMEARRLFATLHLRLGSLIPAKQAFDSLIDEAFARQDYWLAESLLREYLAAGPRCVPYLEKLGSIYQDKGQILDAVAEYAKAIDILIEDPDPDDPQYAARLYQQIRNLAPASPPAIRLNRYFDPQTGELIARPGDVSMHDPSSSDDGFTGDVVGLDDIVVADETADDGGGAIVDDGVIDDGSRSPILSQEPPTEINGAETNGVEWLTDPSPGEGRSIVEPELESESESESE
ncbi:MAG: tetratricopeptide repeat protein, partial [Nitrospira sp.]|nr:tetratricopeptide repeat protein [Nitrospira sp.]